MLLHPPPLLERQRPWLLKKTSGKTNFSYVVNKTAEMSELLMFFRETHASGDISRIDRDRSRVSGRVLISGVESCHERNCERETGALQAAIGRSEIGDEPCLLLIHRKQPLGRNGKYEEQQDRPGR